MLMTWLYKVLAAVLGLVKQVAIKHMHAVGTVGPFKLAVHVAQNCLLESKSRTGTRQTILSPLLYITLRGTILVYLDVPLSSPSNIQCNSI